MIEALWCEQHDLFYLEYPNSQPAALTDTDPISLPTDSAPIYIAWEQILLTSWVIDLYKAYMFFLSYREPDWVTSIAVNKSFNTTEQMNFYC